ncbi:MAG: phytanoyl-CoA dioxygenase family protein [Pyrinomonadaceae bacterium]|nr:phytanoyl-CoA dioxygenase family protein [Pyrinomonadaceae bacterium]MBP6212512.1 phytanoyl-CoA dioxygenase family protein [Pyrinomonadaceae bacterium]
MEPGFEIIENVVTESECRELKATLSPSSRMAKRAGRRHLMGDSAVARLANDERLLQIARRCVGTGAVPFRATLFDKSPRANWLVVWHQDTALPILDRFDSSEWGPWSVKCEINYAHAPAWALERIVALRVNLDASTVDNGPLKVIPGSHISGVLDDNVVLDTAHNERSVICTTSEGGVVAMRPLLIHSSSKSISNAPRLVLHIEYASSLELADGIQLAVA